jgi:hypothetical protein
LLIFNGSPHSIQQLTSSDFAVSTGLISQAYWEQSKWYFVNVERGNIADKLQTRNIKVSFNNNSNVAIDVIIFTFYSDQLTIDVETGIVTKKKNLNIVISIIRKRPIIGEKRQKARGPCLQGLREEELFFPPLTRTRYTRDKRPAGLQGENHSKKLDCDRLTADVPELYNFCTYRK